jgi:hypothetical protein
VYLRNRFPKLSEAKVKEGIIISPQIQDVIQDLDFHSTLSDIEKAAWNFLKSLCTNFLGNHKAENYREIVSEMLKHFKFMKCNMSLSYISSILILTFSLKTWEKLAMNVKDFTKTFPSWKNSSWEEGTVICLQNTVDLK